MRLQLQTDSLRLDVDEDGSGLCLYSSVFPGLHLGPLTAGLVVNGEVLSASAQTVETDPATKAERLTVHTRFAPVDVKLVREFTRGGNSSICLHNELINESGGPIVLNKMQLLQLDHAQRGAACFGETPTAVRIYEQGSYWARVRNLHSAEQVGVTNEEASAGQPVRQSSQFCWVACNTAVHAGLLVGYETAERWLGTISTTSSPQGEVVGWSLEFDGGDVRLQLDERVVLEDVLFLAGHDAWKLLETYADLVKVRHEVSVLPASPVSWCSWYPYRLGVTEGRVLANAAIGAERLRPLGLDILEIDLGWQRDYLPNTFEENDQFPHGLAWLAEQLESLGFRLGAWMAPFTISALDPEVMAHPEWLLGGEGQKPLVVWQWFWEPHGDVYSLDLTHPEAQEWLRAKIRSLAQRGIRYVKPDFIGGVMSERVRDRCDARVVVGGGCEGIRVGMRIIKEEMLAADRKALPLNCGGPDLPGTGAFPLLYTCDDTGNTGYVGWKHLRNDYGQNVAGHLFKQGRWGILQPSCLCVGLPGTLEEARLRATATFMTGGQVDISDDLTTLPEDRWQVLLATLPPLGTPARPVDLFEPITVTSLSYEAMCRGDDQGAVEGDLPAVSCIWHLPVDAGWDRWDLVALFSYDEPEKQSGGATFITRFMLPLERLGLDPQQTYWAYEFWSGQFLGTVPTQWETPHGYVHPGDAQTLIATRAPGLLEVAFFGPGVKLLILRPARSHPWVVGTSFHQSGGVELRNVAWDSTGQLSGELRRPAGQQGCIVVAGSNAGSVTALVGGRQLPTRRGANGAMIVPVITESDATEWAMRWK